MTDNNLIESFPEVETVRISFVESEAIATLESPDFSLDLKDPDHNTLFEFIRAQKRACPSGSLPESLEKVPGLGCRIIEIDGHPGSIICFKRSENEVVHLVVFRREDVAGELPTRANPHLEQQGEWASARWEDGDRVFLLPGQTNIKHLGELF